MARPSRKERPSRPERLLREKHRPPADFRLATCAHPARPNPVRHGMRVGYERIRLRAKKPRTEVRGLRVHAASPFTTTIDAAPQINDPGLATGAEATGRQVESDPVHNHAGTICVESGSRRDPESPDFRPGLFGGRSVTNRIEPVPPFPSVRPGGLSYSRRQGWMPGFLPATGGRQGNVARLALFSVNHDRPKPVLPLDSYPLITPRGRRRATFVERPARWTMSTTMSTSL